MKVLYVQSAGRLAWIEAPSPKLSSAHSALVRPIASASCDLDRRLIAGSTPFKPPFALGHECVAEVLKVGEEVLTVRRGDLVSVPWKIACGTCPQCLAGVPPHARQCRATRLTVSRQAAIGAGCFRKW